MQTRRFDPMLQDPHAPTSAPALDRAAEPAVAPGGHAPLSVAALLALQRTAGNQAVLGAVQRERGRMPRLTQGAASGAQLQRMCSLTLDGKKHVLETADAVAKLNVKEKAEALYPENGELIFDTVVMWAEDEFVDDKNFTSYDELIDTAADTVGLKRGEAAKEDNDEHTPLVTDLKRAWVKVSMDPTEAGSLSSSLDRCTEQLDAAWKQVVPHANASMIVKMSLAGLDKVTEKFFDGKYSCHQNAAKDAKEIFAGCPGPTAWRDKGPKTDVLQSAWDELVFSSRL